MHFKNSLVSLFLNIYVPIYCKKKIFFFFNPSEPGLLQALQRRVEAAERTYKAAELDERLNEFEAARKRQVLNIYFPKFYFTNLTQFGPSKAKTLHQYIEEVKTIKLELSSLSEIERSLPRECWNTIRLEP